MQNGEIVAQLMSWLECCNNGDSQGVTKLYASNAILLPTISNSVRHNHQEIRDYFVDFLAKHPEGRIIEQNVRVFDRLAINSGIYAFCFDQGCEVQARFTFVYHKHGDSWQIIEHHSSQMPEEHSEVSTDRPEYQK